MSVGFCVTKKTPTPFERISRTVCATDSRKALLASLKSRCDSSKKKTSLGLSRSPASGSVSNSSAIIPISAVLKSAGLSCTAGSSIALITPRPSGAMRIRSATSNCGSPKYSSPPASPSAVICRSSTPIV